MPIVFLDTNIYRELGINFTKNIDYQNLSALLYQSGDDLGLLDVVKHELLDYFNHDIVQKFFEDHEKLVHRYKSNPYLENTVNLDSFEINSSVLSKYEDDLKRDARVYNLASLPVEILMKFLLANKRITQKDNTRDFLIFYTLLVTCLKRKEYDHIVFITKDEIFANNLFFKKMLIEDEINNFIIYSSVSAFLKDFGPKLDFITDDLILTSISESEIIHELTNDINCFPSYVSHYYNRASHSDIPELEEIAIKNVEVDNYYVAKDYKSGETKIHCCLRVDVRIAFHPEANQDELNSFLSSTTDTDDFDFERYTNSFDDRGAPVFEKPILFIFDGQLDLDNRLIKKINFIDFMPDHFI